MTLVELILGVEIVCVAVGAFGLAIFVLFWTTGTASAHDLGYTLAIAIGGFLGTVVAEFLRRQFSSP